MILRFMTRNFIALVMYLVLRHDTFRMSFFYTKDKISKFISKSSCLLETGDACQFQRLKDHQFLSTWIVLRRTKGMKYSQLYRKISEIIRYTNTENLPSG